MCIFAFYQAFAQVPGLNIWYGPDSYMGANIAELFEQMVSMTNEEIALIHPKHDRNSIRSLLPRLHYYQVTSHSLFQKQRKFFSSVTTIQGSIYLVLNFSCLIILVFPWLCLMVCSSFLNSAYENFSVPGWDLHCA